jgi:hypothetical protein
MSPAKVPALMYALATNALGGSPSIDIPIAINKTRPPSSQHQSAPFADGSLTADQERFMGIILRLIWAQLNSDLNLGAPYCRSSLQLHPLQPHPLLDFAETDEIERDVSLLEPLVLQVPCL